MKKVKEKERQILEILCIVTAVIIVVLSVMFLFDFWQNTWFLNTIMSLGILFHTALMLRMILDYKTARAITAGILALFYAGALIYFNVL